ncbi:MAG: hypothetical protein RBU27_05375 [Bacteroidota bacterium]|nr:hypothetical protein [Bacteroidota bacterium]
MSLVRKNWQFLVLCAATAVMIVTSVVSPEYREPAMLFSFLGLAGTWRGYQRFRFASIRQHRSV